MNVIRTIIITAVIVLVLAAAGIYSGVYNIAATEPHNPITEWLLEAAMEISVDSRAKNIEVPHYIDDQTMIAKGARRYEEMCSSCHGAPGESPSYIAEGLYPKPPNFGKNFDNPNPAGLFWITKNGIKDSGMPAFGPTHEDEALWEVVAFLNKLPGMSEAEYKTLKSETGSMGGHEGHHHEHGNEDEHKEEHHEL